MGASVPADPVPGLRKAEEPQQGGEGGVGGGVQQVKERDVAEKGAKG